VEEKYLQFFFQLEMTVTSTFHERVVTTCVFWLILREAHTDSLALLFIRPNQGAGVFLHHENCQSEVETAFKEFRSLKRSNSSSSSNPMEPPWLSVIIPFVYHQTGEWNSA